MSLGYDYVLSGEAARALLGSSRSRRRRAEAVLAELATSPFLNPDFSETAPSARTYSLIVRNDVIVTFWVDHSAKEVRIIRVEFV